MSSRLKDYCEKHLAQIQEDLCLDAIAVYRVNRQEKRAELLAYQGEEPRQTVPFGVTPLGECAEKGTASTLEKQHVRTKYQSEMVSPIKVEDQILGVVKAASLKRGFFSKPDPVKHIQSLCFYLAKLAAP